MTTDALDRLLAPCDRSTFLTEHWERRPHAVHRDDPAYFTDLVSRADVDAIAGTLRNRPVTGDQRELEARLIAHRDGQPMSEPVATDRDGSPDRQQLYRGYASGQTVVLGPLGGRWPPITTLCAELEAALHHPVSAHLYLTPAGAQGFPPHHDTHDVFVVQVEGSKTWRIGPPITALPLADDPSGVAVMTEPASDIRLDAGDVLYVPRGWVHEAHAGPTPSLHITLGVRVVRWVDLVLDAVAVAAAHDVALRESLPVGHLTDGTVAERLRRMLAGLAELDDAVLDEALARSAHRVFDESQPTLTGQFTSLATEVELATEVHVTSRWCRVITDGDGVVIELPGRRVRYPASVAPALEALASGRPVAVAALPGELSHDARVRLVRRWIRDGVASVHVH